MPATTLPIASTAQSGHVSDHATLKIDYDTRHPDAPLPALGSGLQSHDVIHELLAADHNANTGGDLPTVGLVALVGSPSSGHIAAHNALHAAYNERH
jgi:hypothetical protein